VSIKLVGIPTFIF